MKKLIITVLFILPSILFGQEQWTQTFGGEYTDIGYSVQQTTDGGYIMTGWENGNQGDVFLVKTDLNGIELSY